MEAVAVESRADNKLVSRRPLLAVCLLLMVGEAPGHGYELTDRLKQWGFTLSGPGAVYRELRLLEDGGLVQSTWSTPQSGPVPRVYELTPAGRVALDQAAVDLTGIERLLDDFQARFRQLPPPAPVPAPAPTKARRTGTSRR